MERGAAPLLGHRDSQGNTALDYVRRLGDADAAAVLGAADVRRRRRRQMPLSARMLC